MRTYTNLDAAESIFLDRQLEQIKSRIYETRYPELQARGLIPSSPEPAPDGVKTLTYTVEDAYGEAKIITNMADDLPVVGEKISEFTQKVRDVGVAFKYDLGEIRAAARLGRDLAGSRGLKARKTSERKLDDILATGDTNGGLKGLLNHSDVSAEDVADGVDTANGKLWLGKTGDEILADFSEVVTQLVTDTKGIFGQGLTVLLPDSKYLKLVTTPRGTGTDLTLLKFIQQNFPMIREIKPWHKCTGAGANGTDRMVVYPRDPEVLYSEIPAEFEVLDPQAKGFTFYVPTRLTTAGVIVMQPKAMAYRDGF